MADPAVEMSTVELPEQSNDVLLTIAGASDNHAAPAAAAAAAAAAADSDGGSPSTTELARYLDDGSTADAAAWLVRHAAKDAVASGQAGLPEHWATQFAQLSSLQRIELARELGPVRISAAILALIRPSELGVLLMEWKPNHGATLLNLVGPSERAEILQQLPIGTIEYLSGVLTAEDLELVKYSQSFPASSVGRLMRPLSTVLHAIDTTPVAEVLEAYSTLLGITGRPVLTVFVTDEKRCLQGVVPVARLFEHLRERTVATAPAADVDADAAATAVAAEVDAEATATRAGPQLVDLSEAPVLTFKADQSQDDMRASVRNLARHSGTSDAFPVLLEDGTLIGVVTLYECLEAAEDAIARAYNGLGGGDANAANFVKSTSWVLFYRRALWLIGLILVNMAASFIIGSFDAVLEENVALASFIPMLIGMGGNAGSQSVALVIAAFASNNLTPKEYGKALRKELPISIALGVLIAVLGMVIAFARAQEVGVAMTVLLAMLVIQIGSDVFGLLLPFLAVAMRVDPELMSNPMLTTVVDLIGLAVYFGFAIMIMGH